MTGAALRFAEHRLGPAHRVGRITLARSSVRAHMSPSLYPSLWSQTATPEVEGERLTGTAPADIAIVGGGFTGCAAALSLAQRGLRVRVLEARNIGWGASGRNGGQVIPGLKYDPDERHPHAVALRFVCSGLLTRGLSPPRSRPCWAPQKKAA